MKNIIRKILREEIEDDLSWMKNNSISGEELEELIRRTGSTSIPFDRVSGYLDLRGTQIKDLGNLESVGGNLYLEETPIKDLGNLQSVGGSLVLGGTPMSKKYSEQEIRQMVQVNGDIYL